MIKRYAIVILLTVLLFGGLFGWKFYQIKQAMSHFKLPPPSVVAATTVLRENWDTYISSVGSLTATAAIEVSSEVAGKIKALHFDSDQPVKKGQSLVELDESTDIAELHGLEASLRLEQVKFARSRQLIAKNFISKSDYDLNKATLDEAAAAVAAKQASIAKKRIIAPFTGQLGIRKVNVGQYIAPGDAIVSLQKLDPIYADFNVPEHFLSNIRIGQQISISVRAYPEQPFIGKITAINPDIDKTTRSIIIRATLLNPNQRLRPGMFVDVKILSETGRSVITVPDTSITYNPYGDSVFVVKPGKEGLMVELRQITTGETRQGRVEILNGLAENERIVSAGQVKLRNGVPVTLDTKAAPGERRQQE